MASCPLSRILTRSDAECERERCQWCVNTTASPGSDCCIKFVLLALHSYLMMKMTGPPPDLSPSPDPGDIRIKPDLGINPEDFRMR